MGKPWLSRAILAIVSCAALAACTALSGVADLVAVEAADTSSEASAPPPTAPPSSSSSLSPTPPSPPSSDASVLADVDATVVDACNATSCEVLPSGFQLVALGSPTANCPSGFGQTPFDGVEQPSLDPGACTCGCNTTQQPSCRLDNSSITLLYGPINGGACPSTGQAVPTGTPCSTAGFQGPFLDYDRNYVAPTATLTGGACGASAVKNATKLKTVSVRMCQATVLPQCEGKTCIPDVAEPFASCIAGAGVLACPASWPDRHVIGASASFTCGAGCTCSVGGQCGTAGSLSYFTSANCSGAAGVVYPVGGCNPTNASNVGYGSHRYDPNPPTNVACQTAGAPSPSTPSLAQETTVCCK